MKKYLLFFCLLITVLSSCKKKEDEDNFDHAGQAIIDDNQIKAYLTTNNITAVKDPSGLYYQILDPGTAEKPTLSNGVGVTYEGTLMSDGTVFETAAKLTYFASLEGLIEGWKVGIPKIGTGGRIKLFVPSGLAYKNTGSGAVPANAVLIFDITLVGFN